MTVATTTRARGEKGQVFSSWVGKVAQVARGATRTALLVGLLGGATLTGGCRVNEDDVHRWESTERGPEKLVAVVTHDKYAYALRTEAALSLIRMRPRAGRRIGIELLTNSLSEISPEARQNIVDGMTPELEHQMQASAPPKTSDNTIAPDPSVPYKDAAFAMLQHEPPLVTSDASKARLIAALTHWVQTDFEMRLENPAQQFGIEQMMRFLGSVSVHDLPGLITESSTKIDRISGLIADLGDDPTKLAGSQALVTLAKKIDSQAWIDKQTPLVQDADNRANQKVTPDQLKQQVLKFQDQELTKVFSSMKRLGGRPVIDYLISFVADPKNSPDRRKTALAALEGRVDKNNTADVDRIFNVAKDDATPDEVRDIAFQRLGELPKDQVATKLYALFQSKKWKVRWVAASLVLKTMTPKQVPYFFSRLPPSGLALNEALTYGGLIRDMQSGPGEPKPRDLMMGYMGSGPIGARLAALGFFYQGKKADTSVVDSRAADPTPIPKCDKDDDCGWTCDIPKPGSADKNDKESKTIANIGEFARYCIEPSMVSP
jgi:hypothetical protein